MCKQETVLIFGGTTEGRKLAEYLGEHHIRTKLSVATEYAKEIGNFNEYVEVYSKRIGIDEIVKVIKKENISLVIDATHPYAPIVTENVKSACQISGVERWRLVRPNQDTQGKQFQSVEDAVGYLNGTEGNIFLTTGSKEIEKYIAIKNFQERVFVRVLPMVDALEKCLRLGFKGSNIICMQGPFGYEMNVAMLKAVHAEYVVTKESGDAGGYFNKLNAAIAVSAEPIVISRPTEEMGVGYEEIVRYLDERFKINKRIESKKNFSDIRFPLFISLKNKKVVVVGGGRISERRIKALIEFEPDITVISPEITDTLEQLYLDSKIKWVQKLYDPIYLYDAHIVLAATNDRNTNKQVGIDAGNRNILVSVADAKQECSFYFPAVVRKEGIVAGIISDCGDHKQLKKFVQEIKAVRC